MSEPYSSRADRGHPDTFHQANGELDERIVARTTELREVLATLEAQKRELELALRQRAEIQHQLEAELADTRLLQDISSTLMDERAARGLYERLLEVASHVMRSDFASMQRFHCEESKLELLAYRGFPAEAAEHWRWIDVTSSTTCGATLRTKARVVAYDAQCSADISPSELAVFERAGIRSVQSTPLLSRSGELLGVISTHWRHPHHPSERDLRLIDVIARQAADLIERTSSEEALRLRTHQLVEADRRKDEFLATLAHELRNPLAPIQNGLAILKAGKPEMSTLVLPMMERQLGHMVRLIDDLLDVSRVSRGTIVLKRERLKLQAVVESAVETSRPLIDAATHRLSVSMPSEPLWIEGDSTRIAQVLSNVLNNAAKYTPQGGRIELTAESSESMALIRITDTGIGIPRDKLAQIFEMFAQVEQGIERAQGGLGLGLSLAQRLVEMHEGTIEARSGGPGEGSTFIIRLPLAAPHLSIHHPGQSGSERVDGNPHAQR